MHPSSTMFTLILIVIIPGFLCDCRQTFVTECDSFSDIFYYYQVHNGDSSDWSDLKIGTIRRNSLQLNFKLIPYHEFNNLRNLYIVGQIGNLEGNSFTECEYNITLRNVHLYQNNIVKIEAGALPGMPLDKLGLVDNNIKTLGRRSFYTIRSEFIDLSYNNIETIERGVFNYAPYSPRNGVKKLYINYNKMKVVHPRSLPLDLQELSLEGNELTYFAEDLLEHLKSLKYLNLKKNRLATIPFVKNLKSIQFLDLSHNEIDDIDRRIGYIDSMEYLDLSYNKIDFPAFLIPYVSNATANLKISLAFNLLESLENIGDIVADQMQMHVHGNPFNCDMWLKPNQISKVQHECDKEIMNKAPVCIPSGDREEIFEKFKDEAEKAAMTMKKCRFNVLKEKNRILGELEEPLCVTGHGSPTQFEFLD